MTIGEFIRENRIKRKMTQAELARKSGISEISIRKYEHEDRYPKLETLLKLANVLGVDIEQVSDLMANLPSEATLNRFYSTPLSIVGSALSGKNYGMLSEDEKEKLTHEVEECISELADINDRSAGMQLISQKEIGISHDLLDAVIKPYQDQAVFDIAELLSYYLMLNYPGKELALEFFQGLYGDKKLIQKTYDPAAERPVEEDPLFV